MNRTRLCTAALFGRNEIKYQRSRESGLYQYILNACTIAGLFVIYTALWTEVVQILLAAPFIEIDGKQKITMASVCDKKEIL